MKSYFCLLLFLGVVLCWPLSLAAQNVVANPFQDETEINIGETGNSSVSQAAKDEEKKDNSLLGKAKSLWKWGKKKVTSKIGDAKNLFGNFKEKFDLAKDFLEKIKNVPGWFRQGTLSKKKLDELLQVAKENSDKSWPPGSDIATGVNAHYTNTFKELKEALESDCTWLECDVRLEGPARDWLPFKEGRRPITAHDSFQANGLLFEDWVKITSQSGRGIKIDLKENPALDGVLETLKKYKVNEQGLILNIGVSNSADPSNDQRLKKIRAAFPLCIINLSPGGSDIEDGHYGQKTVGQLIAYAKVAKKPSMFPLRAEFVTPDIVAKLKPYGKIAIWNSPYTYNPVDVKAEVEKFRQWGVDGIIDIMTKH